MNQQRLTFQGQTMNDKKTMAYYGVMGGKSNVSK